MSFLRHNGFKKYQRTAKKQPFDLTFSSAIKLSLAGCSKASPTSVLPDTQTIAGILNLEINLENKYQPFCPLERNFQKIPTILSITPKLLSIRGLWVDIFSIY